MKHLRKSILTLLALTLFGGAGAWAQGPTVAEIPASTLSGWDGAYNIPITAADLPGFVAVDSATADQWVNASTTGYAVLIYAFTTDGKAKYVRFQPGLKLWGTDTYYREAAYGDYTHSFQDFYTTGGGAIELTKAGANQWSLGQTPDYDLELKVEYYEAHALKNIPAGWTVKVNGVEQQTPYQGDSLLITETDTVTLVPAGNPRRVKSVTLEEDVQTVTIGGITSTTLDITGCTTWAQIIARNSGVLEDWGYGIGKVGSNAMLGVNGGNLVTSGSNYDPSANYEWMAD